MGEHMRTAVNARAVSEAHALGLERRIAEFVDLYLASQVVRLAGSKCDCVLLIMALEVPCYQCVQLTVSLGVDGTASVFAADPRTLEHGNHDGSLCLWDPMDPPERRWLIDDGVPALVEIARAHLFMEERLRETGLWVGDEARHTPSSFRQWMLSRRIST